MSSSTVPARILFGLPLDSLRMTEVVDRCAESVVSRRRIQIGVVNAAKIVNLRNDAALRDSLLECDMILPDGQSVVWASRLLRRPLSERVAGIDLFENLLVLADERGLSVYFLGARPEVLQTLVERVGTRFPGLRTAGSQHGYFTEDEAARVATDIRESAADMLFVGMVSPKKETFLGRYGNALGVPVLHGVGGSFDVLAGVTRRAPVRWQRSGFEWLYRLLQEPRRLWRRYLTTNSKFVALMLRELVRPTPQFRQTVVPHTLGRGPV